MWGKDSALFFRQKRLAAKPDRSSGAKKLGKAPIAASAPCYNVVGVHTDKTQF